MSKGQSKANGKVKVKYKVAEALLLRGLANDEQHARGLVLSGVVVVNDHRCDKLGSLVSDDDIVRVKDEHRYVSRGGDKLDGAIADMGLMDQFNDAVVLDVGASTGGFTDCVLQHGAKTVFAVDVGTNQLAWKLRQDPRVRSFEKTDIREFVSPADINIDWVVADVSFNSLSRLISAVARIAPRARMLLLVKPQFELPQSLVPEGGIVTNDVDRELAISLVVKSLEEIEWQMIDKKDARVSGRSGNREIFILIKSKN